MKKWQENIRRVEPYVPGEQPEAADVIKLNTNENPYPPAPSVLEAAKNIDAELLKLYPDPSAAKLIDALAELHGVKGSQIFAGVGSDDVLSMIFLTFFNSDKPVLFPDITYSFYSVWAGVYGIPYERMPLDGAFRIRAEDYYRENGGVVIANPNAPTSIYEGLDFIEDILRHNGDSVVVVDEAYIDFAGGASALELLPKYENLVVVRTFSKSRSLAGLRIGYAVAGEELIGALNDVKYSVNSYTLNRPAIELGTAAAKSADYYGEITRRVIATRERASGELAELGFECLPSGTNFLFARHKTAPGARIFGELRDAGIYVRHFDAPRIDDYLRITIGTDWQMDRLIAFLKKYA
ncbi:MAG: histidinol-phosphate transaminase [Butyrivibrio sp.]|nr:histidinol-phosphate transaminase [Butyrivibrio sp.]